MEDHITHEKVETTCYKKTQLKYFSNDIIKFSSSMLLSGEAFKLLHICQNFIYFTLARTEMLPWQ